MWEATTAATRSCELGLRYFCWGNVLDTNLSSNSFITINSSQSGLAAPLASQKGASSSFNKSKWDLCSCKFYCWNLLGCFLGLPFTQKVWWLTMSPCHDVETEQEAWPLRGHPPMWKLIALFSPLLPFWKVRWLTMSVWHDVETQWKETDWPAMWKRLGTVGQPQPPTWNVWLTSRHGRHNP